MMADIWQITQTVDLARGVQAPQVWPNALMLCGDSNAHTWRVAVMRGGRPATLAGKVMGYFIRADGATVAVTGSLAGHVASVVLPQSCYTIEGDLQAVLRLADGDGLITLAALILPVRRMLTDSIVDTERIIPSLEDLLAPIERMEQGTQAAATAAGAANTAASNANAKAQAAATAASSATTAASAANTAASNANVKAQAADEAASSATAAAGAANTAASNANAKAQEADEAASSATAAAGAANAAAADADSKAQAADTAAGSATTAASAANTAANEANAARDRLEAIDLTVETLPAGSDSTGTLTKTDTSLVIALGVPRGDRGPQGPKGDKGEPGNIDNLPYATDAPLGAGTPGAGSALTVSRGDHVHPAQTSVSGNAGTATRLQTERKIGNAAFDGSEDISLAQIGAYAAGGIRTAALDLPLSAWAGSGPYTATISREDVTASTWVHLALDAASMDSYSADIDWSTDTPGQIVLTTAVKPTGALAGSLVLMEVD